MIKLTASNGEVLYGVNEYVCDTPEDIVDLPLNCSMGSTALVISTGQIYMRNSEGEWILL